MIRSLAALLSACAALAAPAVADETRVVLVSFDGVRWQDFFDDEGGAFTPPAERPLFGRFWSELAPRGAVFGDRAAGSRVQTVAPPRSLPVYQSLLAGYAQPCEDNDCGRIGVETLPESLRRRLDWATRDAAVFASWAPLSLAAARDPNTIHIDVGVDGTPDGPPWAHSRWDRETVARAREHLRTVRPRFLYLALGDADEWGHLDDRARYLEALRSYDTVLADLAASLALFDDATPTTLLVTTDHGRGPGPLWRYHSRFPGARQVFLGAFGAGAPARGRVRDAHPAITHADVRPTVERLFGLEPTPCEHDTCGRPLPGVGVHSRP